MPALVLAGIAFSPSNALADYVYYFAGNGSTYGNVSHNNAADAATGGQYTVTVSNPGNNQVAFTFRDNGPAQSTIANIYFADGSLLVDQSNQIGITSTGDVNFVASGSPSSLPSAPSTFQTTTEFDASAVSPKPSNGVDWEPGDSNNGIDSVTLTFALQPGKTYQDVINELSNNLGPNGTPQLQIGLHVINFGDGGSESFIDSPGSIGSGSVPEPSTMILSLAGAAGLGLVGLRRLRRRPPVALA